jgi:phosphoglycolate phosphatase-like HAD superfamily hydrolase
MQGLVGLVRQFGCVPTDQILDMHGYKRIYDLELTARVRKWTEKLRRGEMDVADFQIKNACRLLEALHAGGIRLYLTSGTDQQDVVAEAQALGYAPFFEGRIFGAVGDVRVETKQKVLQQVFEQHQLSGAEVATFGDGPVEIRLARKRGAIAVGVASDEVRRYGLNPTKRARLIRAGADLIVPDYSQLSPLLKALGLPNLAQK